MAIRTELNLRLPNSPGALAAVCRALADERVNIVALAVEPAVSCGWWSTTTCVRPASCASAIIR